MRLVHHQRRDGARGCAVAFPADERPPRQWRRRQRDKGVTDVNTAPTVRSWGYADAAATRGAGRERIDRPNLDVDGCRFGPIRVAEVISDGPDGRAVSQQECADVGDVSEIRLAAVEGVVNLRVGAEAAAHRNLGRVGAVDRAATDVHTIHENDWTIGEAQHTGR